MQQTMENTGALERRIDLTVPVAAVEKEVQTRLAKLARSVKMPGFRPGKVPMKMVAATYGAQVQAEVLERQGWRGVQFRDQRGQAARCGDSRGSSRAMRRARPTWSIFGGI